MSLMNIAIEIIYVYRRIVKESKNNWSKEPLFSLISLNPLYVIKCLILPVILSFMFR